MSVRCANFAAAAVLALALVLPAIDLTVGAAGDSPPSEVIWEGDVWINETVVFQACQTLVLRPGTTVHIRMEPPSCDGGSGPVLGIGGRLVAEGNATAPVRFVTFSANGTACDVSMEAVELFGYDLAQTSSIANAEFRGGGLRTFRTNLLLRDSSFNGTYIRLENDGSVVENCTLDNSPLAVLRESTTVIRNCTIRRDSPDEVGILLYDGTLVQNNTVSGCLFGIEAAVWVTTEVSGNTVTGCTEGINSSGGLNLTGNNLTGNGIGLRSWSGKDRLLGNLIAGNEVGIVTLGHSADALNNSFEDGGGARNRRADVQEMLVAMGGVVDGNGQPLPVPVEVTDSKGGIVYSGDPEFFILTRYERLPGGGERGYSPFWASAALAGAAGNASFDGEYTARFKIELGLLPELTIEAFLGPGPDVRPGEMVQIKVTVNNTGPVAARGFKLALRIDGSTNFTFVRHLASLGPGETRLFRFDWAALPGAHLLQATLDSESSVRELDEANNVRTLKADIAPEPSEQKSTFYPMLMLVLLTGAGMTALALLGRKWWARGDRGQGRSLR